MTSTPRYNWFQESAANQVARNTLAEQNHIANTTHADRQKLSYGNQDRNEKLSFATRDAIERNGQTLTSAVERGSAGGRRATLMAEMDARAQTSHDFAHVLLTAKDVNKSEARDIGESRATALQQAFMQEGTSIQEIGDKVRQVAQKLQKQHACETNHIMIQAREQLGDLKNHSTEEYGELMVEQERHFAELAQLHEEILLEQERGFAAFGARAEQHHGDTDRRMANYRSDIDARLDKFGSDMAMTLADVRNDLATQAQQNTAKVAAKCGETKGLVVSTTEATQGLVRKLDSGRLSDALALSQQEALFSKMAHR